MPELPTTPNQTVGIINPVDGTVPGPATIAQKLEETNLLLRAMVILLCNINDVQYDDIISLAGRGQQAVGSALGLSA